MRTLVDFLRNEMNMAMSYSSKKLTDALQRLAEKEKRGEQSHTPFAVQISDQELASKSNSGISHFLRERADFKRATRDVSIGRY